MTAEEEDWLIGGRTAKRNTRVHLGGGQWLQKPEVFQAFGLEAEDVQTWARRAKRSAARRSADQSPDEDVEPDDFLWDCSEYDGEFEH